MTHVMSNAVFAQIVIGTFVAGIICGIIILFILAIKL
jgi:hypothetical protein